MKSLQETLQARIAELEGEIARLRDSQSRAAISSPNETNFRALFEAAPTPFLIILPDAPVFTIAGANNAYLQATLTEREQIVGRALFTVFPDDPNDPDANGVKHLRMSLERAIGTKATDYMPVQKYSIQDSTGRFEERYWRPLNKPVIDNAGVVQYILHYVEDVTKQVQSENQTSAANRQLRTSEIRFQRLAETSGFGLIIADSEGKISYLNPAVSQLIGYSQEEVEAGTLHWNQLTPPEFAARDAEAWQQLFATGKCAPYEKVCIAKDRRRIPVLLGASLLESVEGHTEVATFLLDLRERKQSERDAFLVRLDDATRTLLDPVGIMQTTARMLGEYLHADRCGYCTVQPDQEMLEIVTDYTRPGVPNIPGNYSLSQLGKEAVRLLKANLPYVVEDIESQPGTAEVQAKYSEMGIRARITVPIHKAGQLVAVIGVHQQTSRKWFPEELELMQTVANRCWESIERASITRALQVSEQRLRLAQRAGRIGSFDWFIKENRIIWTPELEALYGLPEGTFEGRLEDWSSRVVAEDAEQVVAGFQKSIARKVSEHTYEFRILLPDGQVRWLRGQSQFFYDKEGEPERMVGVNIDIDAQKQAETHLQQQWRTFDAALSYTPDHIYILDRDVRFLYGNRALLLLWNKSFEELVGKNFCELDFPPELATTVHRQVLEVVATGQQLRDEITFHDLSGKEYQYEYIFTPIFAEDGIVEAVAGSSRDVTARKQTEKQERERENQLRESARLESLGIMAGGIAHDFNNLLTGILGNASLLTEIVEGEEREMASNIMLAAERAADLTKQMLAYSGKGSFIIDILDLNALIQENLTLLRASLARNVTVELELSSEACWIEADRAQMQQVVMNLLINASEAIGDTPGTVAVHTAVIERVDSQFSAQTKALVPSGRYVLLQVRDNGSGMKPETLKKIFDPFFTTKFTGRGLGLAAVLGIIRGHHGDIEVESERGRGTTFRVLLPASQQVEVPNKQASSVPATHASGQNVLVVDDEEIVWSMTLKALTSRGFRVVVATNGEEALEKLRTHADISVVILDLTMPVMTGEQVLPLIKENYPKIPIILSSGFNEAEISHRFASAGLAGFLQKPYSAQAVLSKVTHALQSAAPGKAMSSGG